MIIQFKIGSEKAKLNKSLAKLENKSKSLKIIQIFVVKSYQKKINEKNTTDVAMLFLFNFHTEDTFL